MEFKALRHFIVLAEELSLRRAAQRLNMTQPPLSRQIDALERELETKLVVRDHKGVRLTPEGHILLTEARKILREVDRATRAVKYHSARLNGTIRLGFVSSFAPECLPALLRLIRAYHPGLSFELFDMNTQEQVDSLRRGAIDAAILRGEFKLTGLECRTLWKEDFVLISPAQHNVDIELLRDNVDPIEHSFVQFSPTVEPFVYQQVRSRASEANLNIEPGHLVTKTSTLLTLIASGPSISLAPASLVTASTPTVVAQQVPGQTMSAVCIAWRADDTERPLRSFIQTTLANVSDLAPKHALASAEQAPSGSP